LLAGEIRRTRLALDQASTDTIYGVTVSTEGVRIDGDTAVVSFSIGACSPADRRLNASLVRSTVRFVRRRQSGGSYWERLTGEQGMTMSGYCGPGAEPRRRQSPHGSGTSAR
jgi:hypothetical protein